MDCIVHEVTKNQTRLSNFHFSICKYDILFKHLYNEFMFLFHILFARIVDISICTVYVNMGRSKKGRIKQWKKN